MFIVEYINNFMIVFNVFKHLNIYFFLILGYDQSKPRNHNLSAPHGSLVDPHFVCFSGTANSRITSSCTLAGNDISWHKTVQNSLWIVGSNQSNWEIIFLLSICFKVIVTATDIYNWCNWYIYNICIVYILYISDRIETIYIYNIYILGGGDF